jgi:hypothetical protein
MQKIHVKVGNGKGELNYARRDFISNWDSLNAGQYVVLLLAYPFNRHLKKTETTPKTVTNMLRAHIIINRLLHFRTDSSEAFCKRLSFWNSFLR